MPDVFMPRLSDTMTEGVVSEWLFSEGDMVHRGDVLAEIETDKATMELEAYDEGVLSKILVQPGTTVPIGDTLAVIGESDSASDGGGTQPPEGQEQQAASATNDRAGDDRAGGDRAGGEGAEESASGQTEESTAAPVPQPAGRDEGEDAERVRATPLVRALAREKGIDLATVTGTGPAGRIVRVDLEAALAEREGGREPAAPAAAPQPAPLSETDEDERVPLTSIRRITAQRLTESAAAPHYFLTAVVDVAALLAFRKQINAEFADDGIKISVTDLLTRAVAVVLRAHPEVNASWGGDHVLRRGRVNVGLAVALDDGLIVPVVRDADRKSVREIGAEARGLIERARSGKLTQDEFSGGTFTISNLGMFAISEFTAVINPPEAAILAVGAAVEEPVVRDGQVTITTTMRLTLTCDHRVLDGATGAAFLRDVVRTLEQPLRIVT